MAAGNYDIQAEQGATFKLYMFYRDSSLTGVDLTGCSAEMQVRRSKTTDELILHIDNTGVTGGGSTGSYTLGQTFEGVAGTGGIALNSGTAGSITGGIYITIDAVTMKNIPHGRHFYDLEIIQGSTVDRLLYGRFDVSDEVIL